MLHLIRTEWLKIKPYRAFWVMVGLAVAIIPAGNYIAAEITSQIVSKTKELIAVAPYDFPLIWQSIANVNSYMTALFAIPMIILVTNEFTYKTHRQNIIDGWERREFVMAKLFWWLALSVLAFLTTVITALVLGLAYGTHPLSFENFEYLFYYLLQVLLSLGIATLIAVLVRRSGLAIVLYLCYIMIVEQVLVLVLKRNFGEIGGLLPLQTGDELIPFPVIGKLLNNADHYDDGVYLLMLCLYIGLMIFLVFRRMLKTDY
ncbi:ABC-2 family transporter protein [Chitinophaga rupis]|uniref:ABC-2 family transporter protein n=1 Tax=Chitinophaga rupis TaxID=573321 RepID=A0A1H7GIQ3_9BACT|nr:ABC transporter permease [Chitinophaga rupis]SEK36842.1 ABC-2 family transporter protein [Chitinophaga rupis]